jgi:hypothetical protein
MWISLDEIAHAMNGLSKAAETEFGTGSVVLDRWTSLLLVPERFEALQCVFEMQRLKR